jgi:addiction module HigA family antidote
MVPYKMSSGMVAKACHVPRTRIERIVREETPVTADTALRLEALFGATAAFWRSLQSDFDLEIARASIDVATIERIAA